MNPDASTSHWKASCHEALSDAQNTGANVHLECCLVWCDEPTCMTIEGLVHEVNGRESRFMVRSMALQTFNARAEVNQGKYYYCLKRQVEEDIVARVGIYGTAQVLETVVGPKGELVYLVLRFSHCITIRQLRNGKRVPWSDGYSRTASVLMAHQRPATCTELRYLLAQAPSVTQILDVSEGGACVCIPEELAMLTFTLESTYLFFLQLNQDPDTLPPYVFFAKRAGFGKAPDSGNIAIRLRFLDELDWNVRRAHLRWINVKGGSARLRKSLAQYTDMSQDQ